MNNNNTFLEILNNNILIHGRFHYDKYHNDIYHCDNGLYLYNTASGIEFNVKGKCVSIDASVIPGQLEEVWVRAIINNNYDNPIDFVFKGNRKLNIGLNENNNYNIKLLKVSEAIESHLVINGIDIDGEFLDKPKMGKEIIVIGDSTVSAYGNLGKPDDNKTLTDTDGLLGFAYLTCKGLNASMNSLNGSGWGLCFSPWTTPFRISLYSYYDKVAPFSKYDYDLKKIDPLCILISLGTNDSYYYEDDLSKDSLNLEFKNKYFDLIDRFNKDFPNKPIIMIYGLMREKHNYDLMHEIYLEAKDKYNIYEFYYEGDGMGVSSHPSSKCDKEISDKLVSFIKEILK